MAYSKISIMESDKNQDFVFFESTFQFFCLKRILNFDFDLRGKSDSRRKSAELWYLG